MPTARSAPPPTAAAVIHGLTVSMERRGVRSQVLRGINLEIAPGEIVGLVGESGSGKSVLALTMLGLLPHAARAQVDGDVRVAGVDTVRGSAAALRALRRNHLGVIFQDPMTSLNPTMRVGRQITEITGDTGEALSLLTAVHVPEPAARLRAFPHQLSGGLRQRVMAAIALTGRPSLIVADEPTTALDVTVQAQLLDLLRDLRDEFGCSVLFITHDLAVAAQITDRIAVMYAGRLAEVGPTDQVLSHPSHPYTAGLLGSRLSLSTSRHGDLPTLPPDPATRRNLVEGCAYCTRCPLASDRCAIEVPTLETAGAPYHLRACWHEVGSIKQAVAPAEGLTRARGSRPARAPGSGSVIEVRGLRCEFSTRSRFGAKHIVRAIDGLDLDVPAGEALSLLGESGSGKSTLLRVLAGLTKPTGGSVVVRGAVQMVFQDAGSSLTPWLTIGSLLRERLRPLRLGRAEESRRIDLTIDAIGLPREVIKVRPAELSGGQRQRVALARATVAPPAVLLCDEPTSALDASLAATVLNIIRQMRTELSMTVLFVTHDLAVARLMGDRIAVMAEGRLVEIGDCEQIVSEPAHERTRALLAAVPRIEAAARIDTAYQVGAEPRIGAPRMPVQEGRLR